MRTPRIASCALEILITVALVYAMAWYLGPAFDMYLPPRGPCGGGLQKAKQKRTLADIGNTASALLDWSADAAVTATPLPSAGLEIGAVPLGTVIDLNEFREVSYEELVSYLHPRDDFFYMRWIPDVDGWKNPIEYYFAGSSIPPDRILIRSAGCRGEFAEGDYQTGPFANTDYEQDIVWADGRFVRWPGAAGVVGLRRQSASRANSTG